MKICRLPLTAALLAAFILPPTLRTATVTMNGIDESGIRMGAAKALTLRSRSRVLRRRP